MPQPMDDAPVVSLSGEECKAIEDVLWSVEDGPRDVSAAAALGALLVRRFLAVGRGEAADDDADRTDLAHARAIVGRHPRTDPRLSIFWCLHLEGDSLPAVGAMLSRPQVKTIAGVLLDIEHGHGSEVWGVVSEAQRMLALAVRRQGGLPVNEQSEQSVLRVVDARPRPWRQSSPAAVWAVPHPLDTDRGRPPGR